MHPTPSKLKLPPKLIDELGESLPKRPRCRSGSTTGGDRHRAEWAQKKENGYGILPPKRLKLRHAGVSNIEFSASNDLMYTASLKPLTDHPSSARSVLKVPKQPDKTRNSANDLSTPSKIPKELSKTVAAKLSEDDAQIVALEKKLGIKSKKQLHKSFEDDGLNEFLNILEGEDGRLRDIQESSAKDKLWLAQKQDKKKGFHSSVSEVGKAFGIDNESADSGTFVDVKKFPHKDRDAAFTFDEDCSTLDLDDEFKVFNTDHDNRAPLSPDRKGMRENPYVPPKAQGDLNSTKYLPPSLRKPIPSDSWTLTQLRRQTQGLVNRLTEANLMTILGGVESLYRENARQNVTSALVDTLLKPICEPTTLADTFIILSAGFIAAIYKVVGNDFGAEVIQRTVELFDQHHANTTNNSIATPVVSTYENTKETSNLVTLLAELYNFQVIGSNLIFDYLRHFLDSLSPLNIELLLRIIRVSGPRLRQDDPSALKDIVSILRPAVARTGEENISIRTRFLIETINNFQNNRMKTGAVASTIFSEHTIWMKKILGTLNARSIKASEPMRVSLRDIYESDKRGKWWLVGASWVGSEEGGRENFESSKSGLHSAEDRFFSGDNNSATDLLQLAREQRMNTDIRRAIFITIMSASDYQDAFLRLTKLKLKKVQELEIPKVLIHCSGAENSYNPYYTLIAQKLCGDRRLKMALQFALWDIFRRLGESGDDENEETIMVWEGKQDGFLDTRQLVNVAKMFGALIAAGSVHLTVLKALTLDSLQPRTHTFVEVLCITILLLLQKDSLEGGNERAIVKTFSKLKDNPQIIRSLHYFLKEVVSKTDIAGGDTESAIVRRACKMAIHVLENLLAATPEPA